MKTKIIDRKISWSKNNLTAFTLRKQDSTTKIGSLESILNQDIYQDKSDKDMLAELDNYIEEILCIYDNTIKAIGDIEL